MASLSNMPPVGVFVIVLIVVLFGISLFVLFGVYARYKHISYQISGTLDQDNRFLRYAVNQFADSINAMVRKPTRQQSLRKLLEPSSVELFCVSVF